MNGKILSSLTGGSLGVVGIVGLSLEAEFSRNQLMVIFIVALIMTTFGADLSKIFKEKAGKEDSPPPE